MKATLVMPMMVLLGLTGCNQPPKPVAELQSKFVVDDLVQLEKSRQATFDLDMPIGAGSAVLVGRKNMGNNVWRYRALTAQHVTEEIEKDVKQNGEQANRSIMVTFQPEFHGQRKQYKTEIIDIDWINPMGDWSSFTFDLEVKLECSVVATREEFENIQPWDPIYFVACGGPFGQSCRQGVISATHNVGIYRQEQIMSPLPWNQIPYNFFKFSMPIWYGDSGGPIFSKSGKLIGIANAFTVGTPLQGRATHSGVAVKAHLIHEVVKNKKDFFLIED